MFHLDRTRSDHAGRIRIRIAEANLLSVAAAPRSNWSFLVLRSDDGRTGWGELTLRAHERLLKATLEDLRPSLIGKTLVQVFRDFAARPSLPSGRVGNALLSALDQAATDLLGGSEPASDELGGPEPDEREGARVLVKLAEGAPRASNRSAAPWRKAPKASQSR